MLCCGLRFATAAEHLARRTKPPVSKLRHLVSRPQIFSFHPFNERIKPGTCEMSQFFSKLRWRLVTTVLLTLVAVIALAGSYRYSMHSTAKDFEECMETVEAAAVTTEERSARIAHCQSQFAARRKAGGGYAYYDFMQNRTFDIAGPNPTAEERRQIDNAYMEFLNAQGRDTQLSDLAKRQAEKEQAVLERSRQAAGPPLVLTPKVPLPARRPLSRSKDTSCEDGALSCGWAKLSTAVKNAFASSAKRTPISGEAGETSPNQ
jgi:hypothetical protein